MFNSLMLVLHVSFYLFFTSVESKLFHVFVAKKKEKKKNAPQIHFAALM